MHCSMFVTRFHAQPKVKPPSLLKLLGYRWMCVVSFIRQSMYSVTFSSIMMLLKSILCPVSKLCSTTADLSGCLRHVCLVKREYVTYMKQDSHMLKPSSENTNWKAGPHNTNALLSPPATIGYGLSTGTGPGKLCIGDDCDIWSHQNRGEGNRWFLKR